MVWLKLSRGVVVSVSAFESMEGVLDAAVLFVKFMGIFSDVLMSFQHGVVEIQSRGVVVSVSAFESMKGVLGP